MAATLLLKSEVLLKLADFHGAKTVLLKAYKLKTPNVVEREQIENNLKVGENYSSIQVDYSLNVIIFKVTPLLTYLSSNLFTFNLVFYKKEFFSCCHMLRRRLPPNNKRHRLQNQENPL